MSNASRPSTGAAWTSATLALSACVLLAVTGALAEAAPRTKTCAHISGCSASVSSPPALAGGGAPGVEAPPPTPSSHLAVAVAPAPRSAVAARRTSGDLVTNAERGRRIRCGGYRPKAPTTFQWKLEPTASASAARTESGVFRTLLYITYEVTEKITDTTATGVHFCLGVDFRFKTLSGRPAPVRRLPDGTRGHVGLLPPCPQPLPPLGSTMRPCVEPATTVNDRNSATGVDVILTARVPVVIGAATVRGAGDSGGGDPWGAG